MKKEPSKEAGADKGADAGISKGTGSSNWSSRRSKLRSTDALQGFSTLTSRSASAGTTCEPPPPSGAWIITVLRRICLTHAGVCTD